jgi:uncharacterized protein YdcH (DUF465 family)
MLKDLSDEDLDMAIFEMNFWGVINDLDDRIIELESKESLSGEETLELERSRIRLKDLLKRINNKKGLI